MATKKGSGTGSKRTGTKRANPGKAKRTASRSHAPVSGSNRPSVPHATRIADLDRGAPVTVTVTLRGKPLPSPDDIPAHTLSPDEFAAEYGASRDDIETVRKVLERYGLGVQEQAAATRSVIVSGTAAQMEKAFRPDLGIYRDARGLEFRDREGGYCVPSELKDIVTGVIGFGQRRVARRRVAVHKVANALGALTPPDIEKLYDFPAGDAAGQTIGIAEFGGGYFAGDLAAYCAKHGRPVPAVQAVSINAPAFTLQQILQLPVAQRRDELDASVEVMMDVEVIAGLCPGANLNVYFATFDQKGWVDLLNRAITDRPVALSVSWGMAEDDVQWSPAARKAINERLAAAALLGITVCVASGDDGSGDEETDGRAHVDFPASSPFVLGVGGTMLAGPLAPASERVWWDAPGKRISGGGSTGGGVSVVFKRPKWQKVSVKSLNPKPIDGRVVPDVAAVAGSPLYDLIVLSKDAPNGGTSAAAPVWAALIARVNAVLPNAKRQRFLTPLLYAVAGAGKSVGRVSCNDVTSGNNKSTPPGKGYAAGVGFDAVTGWGTPNGNALLKAL